MIQPCHLQRPPRSAKSPVPHRDCRNFIFITSISLHTTSGCHVVPIFHGCRLVRSVTSTSRLSSGLFTATISIRIITLVRFLGLFLNLYSCVITRILIRNQCELIIEMIFKTKQDLGWTRYTPRIIYLLLLCYIMKQCCYFFLNLV
ncbi:hypothetical protein HanXRQr2_Chr01g0026521 [Helianthus annuus]|uniref:Uncharacterized protein n=1 Tax=Helianthus annuus TaxID=4232 RepID=A0A9K3P2M1_HELAN|nr:hypothetical protein HanXRQr2_Chr01g0026521 [Helianthus annuus]KAJ0957302.1 hypothetical protein HanPSC8_Chr01g0025621 [Helianthus annuus]